MKDLVKQYITEATALMNKQAEEISSLQKEAASAKSELSMSKRSSENVLQGLASCLGNEQYTQKSIVNALLARDTGCLIKEAKQEEVEDDFGSLVDNETKGKQKNIRPSERVLYENLGLI